MMSSDIHPNKIIDSHFLNYKESKEKIQYIFCQYSAEERLKYHRNDLIFHKKNIDQCLENISFYYLEGLIDISFLKSNLDEKDYMTILKMERSSKQSIKTEPLDDGDIDIESNDVDRSRNFISIENSREILYPLIYNIPEPKEIKNKIDLYIEGLKNLKDSNIDIDYQETLNAFNAIDELFDTYSDWVIVYRYLRVLNYHKQGNKIFRPEYINLKSKTKDPIFSFLEQFSNDYTKLDLSNYNKEFIRIFTEVSRDNVITENEKLFLKEKAGEYGISPSQLEYLMSNNFIAFPSFYRIVVEACMDGKITHAEEKYLREKASQYNIEEDILNKMVKEELRKVNASSKYIKYEAFYQLILQYFLLNFLNLNSSLALKLGNRINKILLKKKVNQKKINDTLLEFKEIIRFEFNKKVDFEYIPSDYSIYRIYEDLDIEYLSYREITELDSLKARKTKTESEKSEGKKVLPVELLWEIYIDEDLPDPLKIDFYNKKLILRGSEQDNVQKHFVDFVSNLFYQREFHRSIDTDLMFENLELFYGRERKHFNKP